MTRRTPDAAAQKAFDQTTRVLDALPRAVVVLDRHGVIVGWNRQAETVYGWTSGDVVGRLIGSVIRPPADARESAEVLDTVLGGSQWDGDLRVLRRDGTPIRVYALVAPLRDDDGRVVGVVAAADEVTDLRRVEKRTAELTEHLNLALAAGQLGTWRWDATTGKVTWDEQLERIFGLAPGSFDGTFETWVSLLHPDDRDEVLAAVDRATVEQSSYQVDHRVVWPDGTIRWLQGRGNVTFDESGNVTGTIGCTGDITERKHTELHTEKRADAAAAWAQYEFLERERLQFLVGLTDASISAETHKEFMEAVTHAAVPRLGDWCSLHFIPEPSGAVERYVAHSDASKVAWANELSERYPYDPRARTGVPAVIRSGRTEFIPRVDQAMIDEAIEQSPIEEDAARAIVDALSLTSVITVPLMSKRGVIGAMQFVSAESEREYGEEDVALAQAAAGRIAAALENLWLTDQHRNISATLQRSLLPPEVPEIPGVEVAVRYWPAGGVSEVGGDFYDVFPLDPSAWAVVIGDVCGTGPDAAAVTGIARHTLRAASRHGHDHSTVLEWINEAVGRSGRHLFCTACYATLRHSGDGRFRFACGAAGHPLPIVVRANGRATTLGRPGTLLGVFDAIDVDTAETELEPGDVVILYTDGITDLPEPHGMSDDQTLAFMREAARGASAEEIADDVRLRLASRLPIEQRADDIALVVLRCSP